MSKQTNKAERFLDVGDLRDLYGIKFSRVHLWRMWAKERTFPAPVKLSKHTSAWRQSDIVAWIASRKPLTSKIVA